MGLNIGMGLGGLIKRKTTIDYVRSNWGPLQITFCLGWKKYRQEVK
jgi:hypothetical protein